MSELAPRWAFSAQAIDGVGDPQLQSGIHLRLIPSALLGLPAVPFEVSRVGLGPGASQMRLRHDITWRTIDGAPVAEPFDPAAHDGAVVGYLPAPTDGVCCWIEVDATPGPRGPGPATAQPARLRDVLVAAAAVVTERGSGVIARRNAPPYHLAASRIEQVIVRGRGDVRGVSWVDARQVTKAAFWRQLALPHAGGARYLGIANAGAESDARVQRGAPRRQGLHDAPSANTATAGPTATPADETTRLSALTPDVLAWVDQLINDTSAAPGDLVRSATLQDSQGRNLGTLSVPTLPTVLQAAMDPGIGRWLGLVELDDAPPSSTRGDVVAYVVRGIWQVDTSTLGGLETTLPDDAVVNDTPEVHEPPIVRTSCDDFADLAIGTTVGNQLTHAGNVYRSLGSAALSTSDVVAPPGVAELAFHPIGLGADLPQPVDTASVDVAQFNGAPFVVRGFNNVGGLTQLLTRTPPVGVLDHVPVIGPDLVRIEIVSLGPPASGTPTVAGGGGTSTTTGTTGTTTGTTGTTTGTTATTTGPTTPGGGTVGTVVGGGGTITPGGSGTITPGGGTIAPGGGTTSPTIPPAARQLVLARLCQTWTTQPPVRMTGPFLDLSVVACASIGVPPTRPTRATLDAPRLGPWAPLPPPQARREIVVPGRGFVAGATVAFAREDATGIVGLNPRSSVGRALPLVPSVPGDATETGAGELADREAPPEAITYRCAQADWFGRWSPWARRAVPAGVRPAPPAPVLVATYRIATVPSPMPTTQLSGTIDVRVPVPPPASLPPAGELLASLEVRVTVEGTTTTTTAALPTPATPPNELALVITGPAIPRAETREVTLVGTWIDAGGRRSLDAIPVTLAAVDPRPPDQVVLPGTLRYTARPDVTGWARAELVWTPTGAQQRFRVFVADESTVKARLTKVRDGGGAGSSRAGAALTAVAAATTLVARGAAYTSFGDALTRDMFEQLTSEPIERPSGGAQVRFAHGVSGSLRVLSLYRVVAVSAANVEADFTTASLVPTAVPNTSPPPQPLLTARPEVDATNTVPYRARLRVRVPRGLVVPAEFRLRRSRLPAADATAMPIVATGTIPTGTVGAPHEFEVIDIGSSQIAPGGALRPWVRYDWRVEVRGGPEPGGGPSAEWSQASMPAGVTLVPADPPAAATNLSVTRSTGGPATVTWKHADPLIGGSSGGYQCDVHRRIGDAPEALVATIEAEAPPSAGGRSGGTAGSFSWTEPTSPTPPAKAAYRVVVVDPIGRQSPPTPPAEA
jgi:hypothetical protein